MIVLPVLISIIILFLGYIYWVQTASKYGRMLNVFPGPYGLPIIGNILEFRTSLAKIFILFQKYAKQYKETYRTWTGPYGTINIVTAEDAEILLTCNKNITKALIYEFLQEWLGTGLLTSTGKKWQQRRKLLTPAFHFNILKEYCRTFGEHSMELVENLKKECVNSETDIFRHMTHTTLKAICETAMGTSITSANERQQKYFSSLYDIGPLIIYRITTPWLYNNFIFNMMPIGSTHHKLVEGLHKFTSEVIKERETNFKDSDLEVLNNEQEYNIGGKKKLAMLDLLISAKKNNNEIDDDGIREEVDTFMFEGHDTTAIGLSFFLMVLANNKEHQEKIAEELKEIFESSNRPASYNDLQKMNYLELCLKESLRLYPSVPLIGRVLTEDLKLTSGVAPAGCFVNLHIYEIHHNPRYFPNPDKFDPSRFLPENCKGRHPFAYIPFSAGPRNCIGQKFAMLEIKSIVSAILRYYVLDPVDTPETIILQQVFVLKTDENIRVKLTPRT